MPPFADSTQALRRGETPPDLEIHREQDEEESTGGSLLYHCRLRQQTNFPNVLAWLRELEDFGMPEEGYLLSEVANSRTVGAISDQAAGQSSDDWDRLNRRRLLLIEKRARDGLETVEQNELDQLQAEAATYVDALAPLPFAALDQFERQARAIIEADPKDEGRREAQ